MQLYTSLVRLKMVMNDGQMPPMTPVPERALAVIDPAFTIGLGGLTEDAERGLRCPVRGCGRWYHNLSCHITWKHAEQGGPARVRELLQIPHSAPLVSSRISERGRAWCLRCGGTIATVRTLTPVAVPDEAQPCRVGGDEP